MNFSDLFLSLFPGLAQAVAVKVIHQVDGMKHGDDVIARNKPVFQAIAAVAAPYIAHQVGMQVADHLANGTMPAAQNIPPPSVINLGAFLPTSVTGE